MLQQFKEYVAASSGTVAAIEEGCCIDLQSMLQRFIEDVAAIFRRMLQRLTEDVAVILRRILQRLLEDGAAIQGGCCSDLRRTMQQFKKYAAEI